MLISSGVAIKLAGDDVVDSGQVINHRTMEGEKMADDRMRHDDDLQRNMGSTGREDQDFGKDQGKQTPGRNPQGGQQGGQYGGGQQGQQGGQRNNPSNQDDEDEFGGGSGQKGGPGRGGQNR